MSNKSAHSLAIDALFDQLMSLRHDVAGAAKSAGRDVGREASHLTDELVHQGGALARSVGRKAARAGRGVAQDPLPAVAAIAGILCLVRLASGRRRG